MILITINRLLYKITDKDYKQLRQLEKDTTSSHKDYHLHLEEFLAEITLKYKASNVIEGEYRLEF